VYVAFELWSSDHSDTQIEIYYKNCNPGDADAETAAGLW